MARHIIQGREVTTPVEVRDATFCGAAYLVRADAARAVLAYADAEVAEVLPGKAVCVLGFVRYHDGDLGPYNEFCVAFQVRPADGPRDPGRAGAGVFTHWLPVDQGFTLEAGRTLWGFPKELADIDVRIGSPYKRCIVRRDGRLVLDMLLRPGVPVPVPAALGPIRFPRVDAVTCLDGLTRRVPLTSGGTGVRLRPGGALIRLGNHPIAKELSELGLPKTALVSVTARHVRMSIGEAVPA